MAWKIILERLYHDEKITVARLENAVIKGLITEEDKQDIINSVVE